jgi:hypothetical protein
MEVDLLIRPQQGWALPKRNARHICKLQTQGMSTSWAPQRRSATQTQGTSTSWAPPQCKARPQDGRPNEKLIHKQDGLPNARHVHKMGTPNTRQVGRPNANESTSWGARPQDVGSAQTQRKARPQDGRPNAKLDPQRKRPHKGALG